VHQGRAGRGTTLTLRGLLALLLYVTAGTAYALDRLTKILAESHLQGRPPVEVIPDVFQLRFITNPGGAFGMFGGATWLFALVSVVVAVVVVAASFDLPSRLTAVALGMVLGGAIGNLTDRVIRGPGFSGEVVDFFDFHVWPVFNVADSVIVTGAAILLFAGFRREKEPARSTAAGAEEGA
jgi:signal peptidase II